MRLFPSPKNCIMRGPGVSWFSFFEKYWVSGSLSELCEPHRSLTSVGSPPKPLSFCWSYDPAIPRLIRKIIGLSQTNVVFEVKKKSFNFTMKK